MINDGKNKIETLEQVTNPCWLWDPLLSRISWANKAALRFWDADTIFDVLERRFNPQEQSVQFINGCYHELNATAQKFSADVSGYSTEETLSFPMSPHEGVFKFRLSLMGLADQRIGLLVEAITHPFMAQNPQDPHAISLTALPMPALLINSGAEIISANEAAKGFLKDPQFLAGLVKRCETTGMVNDKLSLETNFGKRDIQYSIKKLHPEETSSTYLMMFDDVTERKRTEKELLEKLEQTNRRALNAKEEAHTHDTGGLKPEEADKFLALRNSLRGGDKPPPASQDAPSEQTSVEHLQAILNAAMDGIFTLDKTGQIITMNAGAEAIFGRRSSEVLEKKLSCLFDIESRVIVDEYISSLSEEGIARIFNDGREVYGVEKQGGKIPIFLTINPLPCKDGAGSARYCALVRDITQWKETETELRRAKEEAEQASLDKSSFLNSLSHEIRTPLNAILGFVDLMKTEKFGPLGDKRYKGYLTDIQTSGKHLMELTSGLLDLARMQAGKLEMDFTQVETSSIIEQCVSILQEEANRVNILIRTDLHDDLPHIVADQGALRQIILNLLSNSIKFSKAGSQIIISTQLDSSGEVVINVSDTGIGMNKDELKQALEPFSQTARGKKATKVSGTGLGLPLSKALTEANRARFEISSSPKKGTTAKIIFPNSRVLTD